MCDFTPFQQVVKSRYKIREKRYPLYIIQWPFHAEINMFYGAAVGTSAAFDQILNYDKSIKKK